MFITFEFREFVFVWNLGIGDLELLLLFLVVNSFHPT